MNIMQLFQTRNLSNPKVFIENFMSSNPEVFQNPIAQNAINMVRNNDISGLKSMAQNLYQERGLDINQVYAQVSSMINNNRR